MLGNYLGIAPISSAIVLRSTSLNENSMQATQSRLILTYSMLPTLIHQCWVFRLTEKPVRYFSLFFGNQQTVISWRVKSNQHDVEGSGQEGDVRGMRRSRGWAARSRGVAKAGDGGSCPPSAICTGLPMVQS